MPLVPVLATIPPPKPPDVEGIKKLRYRLRGKWLFFLGDSTLRGLWLALFQQIILHSKEQWYINTSQWAVPPTNSTTKMPWHPQGWLDVIFKERADGTWQQVALTESQHVCPWPAVQYCQPGTEMSAKLNRLWCDAGKSTPQATPSPVPPSYIRITYRQLTMLRFTPPALTESNRAWSEAPCLRARDGPDGILFQSGMWDLTYKTEPNLTRALLVSALAMLRSLGRRRENATPPERALAYASLPTAWPLRDDADGQWQRAVVEDANAIEMEGGAPKYQSAPLVAYFERIMHPHRMLSASCLSTCHLPNHPPHAINVPLLPRMLSVWLGQLRGVGHAGGAGGDGHGTARHATDGQQHRGHNHQFLARDAVRVQESQGCCCGRPPSSRMERANIDMTAYWAVYCPLAV